MVARLHGEIDLSNAARLFGELADPRHDAPALVVDLTEVAYMDSAALRQLEVFAGPHLLSGRPLRLVAAPGSPVRRLLEIVAMDEAVTIADSIEEAMRGVGGRGNGRVW